jgi:hypothetical protein
MKEGKRWAIVGAPPGFEIEDRPDTEPGLTSLRGRLDGCVLFCTKEKDLVARLESAMKGLVADGGIWIAWPKKSSSLSTTLDFDTVQHAGLDRGLVDNKVCAIDEDWSGLRFVVRTADRTRWPNR